MDILKKVRPNILKLQAYSSARDEFEGTGDVFLDANENPFQNGLNRYPDPYQRELKNRISTLKNKPADQIFLGNGSDEAIDLIIRIFCEPGKDNLIISDPSYGMYQVSAAINNVGVQKVALTEDFEFKAADMLQQADQNTKIAFICSPNNPSGNAFDVKEIEQVIQNFDGIVVIDEAYSDFSSLPSFLPQLNTYKNLVVLQTFSKAWGLAGVRLGMAFSSSEIIALMNKVKPPYNINSLTQVEALKVLADPAKVQQEIRNILEERGALEADLAQLNLVEKVFPSEANFLLVKFQNAQPLFEYLISKNIIIRNRTNVMHGRNCLRITIGTREENKALLAAIKEFEA